MYIFFVKSISRICSFFFQSDSYLLSCVGQKLMLSSNSIFGSLLKCIFFRLQFPISTESRRLEVHYRLAHSEGRNPKKVPKFNVKSKYCFFTRKYLYRKTFWQPDTVLIFISLFYRHYFFIFKALFLSHFPLLCQKIAKGEQLLQGGDLKLTYLHKALNIRNLCSSCRKSLAQSSFLIKHSSEVRVFMLDEMFQ